MKKTSVLYVKDNQYFLYDGKSLEEASPSNSSDHFTGVFVSPLALYMYSAKMSASLSEEQREVNMDIAMHEEGGADANEEYSISLLNHPLPNDADSLVDVFGLTQTKADFFFEKVIDKTKCIDYIIPSFFAYDAWYFENPQENVTELVLYLGDEDAYGVIYQNGKYVAHRTIEHLSKVAAETGIDLETLKAMLKTKGMDDSAYAPDEIGAFTSIQEHFAKSIERLAHTINHKRGLFGLDEISSVLLDFEGSSISGLEDVFSAFGMYDVKVKPLSFGTDVDPLASHDILNAKYLYHVVQNNIEAINVSPFERQPPFIKQPVAPFLLALLISIGLSVVYPFMLSQKASSLDKEAKLLKSEIKKQKSLQTKREKQKKTLNTELSEISSQSTILKQEKEKFEQSIDTLPLVKTSAKMRQKMVDDALKNLKLHGLKVRQIDQNSSRSLSLHLIASEPKRDMLAAFMKDMAKLGYQQIKTQKIYKTDDLQESVVEIVR